MIASREAYRVEATFSDLVSNWEEDLIFGVTSNPNYVLPSSDYYLKKWNGYWPGSVDGCYCKDSARIMKVSAGLKRKTCNENETLVGCKNVKATDSKDLDKWSNSQNLFTIKMKGANFMANYLNIDTSGNCVSSSFMYCGKKTSVSKGICISSTKFLSCPLTDISETSKNGYNTTSLSGFSLYVVNDNNANPICDAKILEGHMCFVRTHFPRTAGRNKYSLMNGEYEACIEDKLAWSVGQVGEKTFFDLNTVPYENLLSYGFSDDYKYKLMLGRVLEWSPFCSDTVPTMSTKKNDLTEIAYQYTVLIITYSISFSFAVILIFLMFMAARSSKTTLLYKVFFVLRLCFFVLSFPSLILTVMRVNSFIKYLNKVVDLQCTNDQTNENFRGSAEFIKKGL
jgi:hypothetical protein